MILLDVFSDFKELVNPETIVLLGLPILLLVIFAETGLFFGFFFPGDSLLFTAGLLAGAPSKTDPTTTMFDVNIYLLVFSVFVAAVLGNIVGYYFGKFAGARLYRQKDTLLFKKKHLDMADAFYKRNGAIALIGGRFLPIFRTFIPIVAGMIKMDFPKFMMLNVLGAFLWVFSFILAGYFLGRSPLGPYIRQYLEFIIIGLIIVTLIPVVTTYLRERRNAKKAAQEL